jgi:hypothetical protein
MSSAAMQGAGAGLRNVRPFGSMLLRRQLSPAAYETYWEPGLQEAQS